MSFGGGGTADYRINYIISTKAEGSAAGPINQVSAATDKMTASNQKAIASSHQLDAAHNRVTQAQMGQTKAMKGMAFGLIGITTAGAELGGMLSMWEQVSTAQAEAQAAANQALREGGKDSKEYKDAMQDVAKVNRWAGMTFRNLMLSMFDMIPFIIMSVNGMAKLRTAMKALREAKAAEQALKGIGMATSSVNVSITKGVPAIGKYTGALGSMNTATNATAVTTSRLGTIMQSTWLKILGPIGIAIGAIILVSKAWRENWLGLGDAINNVGVQLGKMFPWLKPILDGLTGIGNMFADISEGKNPFQKPSEGIKEFMDLTEDQQKELQQLKEDLFDFQQQALDRVKEVAQGDKGDRKDFFKLVGIKGDFKDEGKELFKELDDMYHEMDQASAKFETLNAFESLEDFGIKIDPGMLKKMISTLGSDLQDVVAGDDDIFSQLGDLLKEKSDMSLDEFETTVRDFLARSENGGTELIQGLIRAGEGDLAKYFSDIKKKYDLELQAWNAKVTTGPNSVQSVMDKITGVDNVARQKAQDAEKNKITQIVELDIQDVAGNTYATTGSTTAAGAGAFGAIIYNTLLPLFHTGNWQTVITNLGSSSFWGGIAVDLNHHIAQFIPQLQNMAGPGADESGGMNIGQGQGFSGWMKAIQDHLGPIFSVANWGTVISLLGNTAFWSAIGLSINVTITNALNKFKATPADEQSKNETGSGGMGPSQFIYDHLAPLFDTTTWSENIEKLKTLLQPTLDRLGEWFNNIKNGVIQGVEGATGGGTGGISVDIDPSTLGKNVRDVLGITNAPVLTADIPNMIIKPDTWTPDLSNATPTIKPSVANGGREGGGAPGVWDEAYALYIDYPGTAVVTPTSTVINIDWANIMKSSQITNLALEQGWITLMTNMSSLANTTVQAIALVFGGMVINISAGVTGLAETWSAICNSFGANAQSGSEQIQSAIDEAMSNGEERMSDLASHWSSMCNSLINNAEAAADGINDALDSIEDEEVVIRYRTVGSTGSRFAHGTDMFVHKPTVFMAGEAGSERVQVSRAGSGREGGDSGGASTIHLHQHILERELVQILNIDKGRMVSKFGPN